MSDTPRAAREGARAWARASWAGRTWDALLAALRPRARGRELSAPGEALLLRAWAEAYERAFILLEPDGARLAAGASALDLCARALGTARAAPDALLAALARADPAAGAATRALDAAGTPFDITVRGPAGVVRARGRPAGALALVILSPEASQPQPRPPPADPGRLADVLDTHPHPAFILGPDGAPSLVNRAWLAAAGAGDLAEALTRGLTFDRGSLDLAREALAAGAPRERVRWAGSDAARRALRIRAAPLPGGGAAVWTWDVTQEEAAADAVARQGAGQGLILGAVADAVAIFGADRRLAYHNPAFADLWSLEAAWLAEGPGHGAILDRLRQRGRLPETADYGRFKAEELGRHERLSPAPEAIWRIDGQRILRVLSLPHPAGGLILIYSDITPEVRLKSQFNHLIQVQQATLDKLTDAVAVFGPDARLKLHNEAFQRLWAIPAEALAGQPAFDDIVDRCVAHLHDMHFWNELKGRISDPDPGVRAAIRGEAAAADGRRLAWQSRPLPDGATLVSFVDVTATRRLERALRDREAALGAAEQLKREFVSSVSHELRTPLTTILGYAELLGTAEEALSSRAQGWVGAVRAAAVDLARSVDDILAFAEIDAGEMILDLADTDVARLLSETHERWAVRAAEAAVTLATAQGEAPGALRADRRRLARVLDHLVEHALRQTQAGGRVTLSARRALGEVCLEVADTGRGIPFHVQAHIFDRFSGEEGTGAGLGLALVKALVELHGGWVALESEPGAGATFACHLPEGGQSPA